ncbi:MAG: VWA domain-containing protein [Oscillospiraceae bacterium]|jgi:hypothetical protein|nr:VWA domain-containing protein [Oscillospiraceae bacterium]
MDTSLSLHDYDGTAGSDPLDARYDAMGRILFLLPETGSRAAIVTFDRSARKATERLEEVDTALAQKLRYDVAGRYLDHYTNITAGMETALSFFPDDSTAAAANGVDPDLPRLIVLFTDGQMDLPGGSRAVERAKADLRSKTSQAKESGVRIATIALNHGGSVPAQEIALLADIASPGLSWKANSAEELDALYDAMHSMLFTATKQPLEVGERKRFTVKPVGTIALTVTFTEKETITLTSPQSKTLYTEKDAIAVDRGLYVIHIPKPEYGQWEYALTGTGGIKTEVDDGKEKSFLEKVRNKLSEPGWRGLGAAAGGLIIDGIPQALFAIIPGMRGWAKFRIITAMLGLLLSSGFVLDFLCPNTI